MNFSFFMMPLHVPGDNPSLAFQRDIELIAYVDHLGFDEFWIGEHHSAGWETMPSPEMALAKASAACAENPARHVSDLATIPSPVSRGGEDGIPGPPDKRQSDPRRRAIEPSAGHQAVQYPGPGPSPDDVRID